MLGILGLLPAMGAAQERSDLMAWSWAGLCVQPDSSHWIAEVTPSYTAYENLTRTYLRQVIGRLGYAWPAWHGNIGLTYRAGPLDQEGIGHLAQVLVGQHQLPYPWRPRWQLTLDRLWLSPALYQDQQREPIYRVRTLVGVEPPLGQHLYLVLNTEPFLYRTDTWLTHVRSQAGVQLQLRSGLTTQLLYWNWWSGYSPRRVSWQHTILLTAVWHLSQARLHPICGR